MPIEDQHPSLRSLSQMLEKDLYGMTQEDANKNGVCINCKKEALPRCYSDAGKKEYTISGLCEQCFDELFDGDGGE